MTSKKISLEGRKRTNELTQAHADAAAFKRDLLLSMKDEDEQNRAVEVVYQKEIKAAVRTLARKYQRLREAGTTCKYQYTPYEQHRLFLDSIKDLLAQRAEFYAGQGMEDDAIQEACQEFVDDVRAGLRQIEIHVNPLRVTQKA